MKAAWRFSRCCASGAMSRTSSCMLSTLLQLEGRDLRREPIETRKAALAKLIRGAGPGLQLSEHLDGHDGSIVFKHACKLGLEGIVSKRRGSRYRSAHRPPRQSFRPDAGSNDLTPRSSGRRPKSTTTRNRGFGTGGGATPMGLLPRAQASQALMWHVAGAQRDAGPNSPRLAH